MAKRTGLGRGIGALIPTADQAERPVDVFFPGASIRPTSETDAETATPELEEVPGIQLIQLDPQKIVPNPRQPRTHFDPEHLAELVHSVREFGVLQPVVVRTNSEGDYELIPLPSRGRSTSSSWASVAPVPLARLASTRSPRSSARRLTKTSLGTRSSRTCTAPS